jgi:thiamine-phosphate pyrophosphorylase
MQAMRGLYAIASTDYIPSAQLVARVALAIAGGAVMVQYRDKSDDHGRRLWEANDLAMLCRSQRVPFIINDDIALARGCQADGVHLGRDDANLGEARAQLGPRAILGASCYDSIERAQAAVAEGADYIAFGSFFPSRTKPDAVHASLELLHVARDMFKLPITAIGGITAQNGGHLVNAGAQLLAVSHAVFAAPAPDAAARELSDLFTTASSST